MARFRRKPLVVEAQVWPTEPCFGVVEPYMDHAPASKANGHCDKCGYIFKDHGWVKTLEGGHIVCPHDRIIKGVKGEFYPCKPDIFEATYDVLSELHGDGGVTVDYADQVANGAGGAGFKARCGKCGQVVMRVTCGECQPVTD